MTARADLSGAFSRWLVSDRRLWWGCLALFLAVFGATAHWYDIVHIDTQAADWGSWQLVHAGTFDLGSVQHLPHNRFFVVADGRLVAGRSAGVIVAGMPFQLLLWPFGAAPETAGALAGVVLSAVALANTALLCRRLGADRRLALAVAVVLGLGTPVWTISAAELWTHSPDLLWISLGLLAAERSRWVLCGLALSGALWTRPHLAVLAATVAVSVSWSTRRARPVVAVGATTGVALLALVGWNTLVFGTPSVSGFYGYAPDQIQTWSFAALRHWSYGIAMGTASPLRGFVLYSPVVVPALWAGVRGWRTAPAWTRGAFVGGVVYLIVQWRLNDYQGGTSFFGNRLVIETFAAATPLCVWGYFRSGPGPALRWTTRGLAAVSVATHGVGALLAYAPPNFQDTRGAAWRHWLLLQDVQALHGQGWAVLGLAVAACAAVALEPLRHRPSSLTAVLPME